ncbi:MAG: hypothetical protein A3G60_02230 [Candidatus Ryanbacteria bacterium RIFCSPLOWO2_12_FULL_47_9c]|uniref:Uncharacterized protein n=1 Tax=Candidatus Ryanbacteria bacterium RIFCSPLOWO2_12_FULL_47_9c TaxID=1802131 RepID=A0A1G2H1R7_9BACT|nr:MAG: hypothetical protein A3G60_02230 [Candidatus Ryanbacteria bacterium RIFCSPLOWO2_12_FULL_47_9c]
MSYLLWVVASKSVSQLIVADEELIFDMESLEILRDIGGVLAVVTKTTLESREIFPAASLDVIAT